MGDVVVNLGSPASDASATEVASSSNDARGATAHGLIRRSLAGGAWTLLAYGGAQVLRLISNLVLTRLLAPEYFGQMALVNVFLIGVNMFSDLGLGPSVVQSERGGERRFLNTAWTLQGMRGAAIWLLCIAGAWPFAHFYRDPMLVPLVIVTGLTAVISGLNSTKLLTAFREISIGRVTLIELGSQILTVAVTVAFASLYSSVWALVNAALVGAVLKMLASHYLIPGPNDRWAWDAASVHELIGFGKWIFLSTVLSFATNSAASLILGRFVSMTEVGVFSIAVTLAGVVGQAYEQIGSKVLFPLYAKVKTEALPQLRTRVAKIRLSMMALFVPPLWVLSVFGQQVVNLLLDHRYHDGGWILRLFASCAIPSIVTGIGPFYLALGNSRLMTLNSAIRLALYVASAFAGLWWGGAHGLIVGIAAHSLGMYLVDATIQWRYRIWIPALDALGLGASAAVVLMGVWWQGAFW